jgi:hypothetical protein
VTGDAPDIVDELGETVPDGWAAGLDADEVLSGQGIDPRAVGTGLPLLREAAGRALLEGRPLLAPGLAIRAIELPPLPPIIGSSTASAVLDVHAAHLPPLLTLASRIVFGVCTIGARLERRAGELMETDPLLALALDGLGTAAVERLVQTACASARAAATARGWGATPTLSPGTTDWPLADGQALIFGLVDPGRIGVRANEAAHMTPAKSLSFAVGLGPAVPADAESCCAYCEGRDRCRWRTTPA